MHEDPTRHMDLPPPSGRPPEPPRDGISPALKATVAILVAAVLGLGIALAVVAGDSGEESTAGSEATESVPVTDPTTSPPTTSVEETPQSTSTTAPETTTPTTTTETAPPTVTESTTTVPTTTTETGGSGGVGAP